MPHFPLRRLGALVLTFALLTPDAGALSGVSNWAQTGVAAAQNTGLAPAAFAALPATAPVTRAEFCAVALNTYQSVTGETAKSSGSKPFTDCDDPNVIAAYELGLVSGRGGKYQGTFDPDATIQRQDLCVMLYNVIEAADIAAPSIAGEAAIEDYPDQSAIETYARGAMTTMVDYAIVSGVTDTRTGSVSLQPKGEATREQALIMADRFCTTFENNTRPNGGGPDTHLPVVDDPTDIWTGKDFVLPASDAEKMALVYGAGGTQYQNAEEAAANMTEISVKVWRLQADGSKTTGTAYIEVNKNLAPLYQKIFEEIYNGDEKFPIKNVGCYAWRTGEHSQGTAIDLNWEENMEATINADGTLTPTTGTHWTPGEDPYSIPEGGDVYNAFTKYGFAWGGNAWTRKRDYMHFSYFGR